MAATIEASEAVAAELADSYEVDGLELAEVIADAFYDFMADALQWAWRE